MFAILSYCIIVIDLIQGWGISQVLLSQMWAYDSQKNSTGKFPHYRAHIHTIMYIHVCIYCVHVHFVYIIYSLGVSCPRAGSNNTERQRQQPPAEPYGQEAMNFTKELILQREVDVEVENCDKGGNFIGWMFVDGRNLAVSLVEVTPSLTINNY